MTAVTLESLGLQVGTWAIDPTHTSVGFTVRHLMSKVRGSFTSFEGTVEVAENPLESTVNVSIDVASVNTHNEQRDGHLRTSDFFAVEQYPTITFTSTGISYDGEKGVLTGDLTVRGVTKQVALDAEYLGVGPGMQGELRAGFEASTTIDRNDFGVDWNMPLEGGRLVVGSKVEIRIETELVLQS